MTEPTVCKQLDELEEKLPPVAAGVVRFNRALVNRTIRSAEQVGSMASSSLSALTSVAETGLRTVTGTARWAADRTASTAATGARQTVGQAKAQVRITSEAAAEELEDIAEAIDPDVKAVPDAGRLETMTKRDLYDRAQELEIEGRSSMTKAELVDAIRAA